MDYRRLLYAPYRKRTYQNFRQRSMSDIALDQQYAAVLVLPGDRYMEEEQTELETANK